jgi:outer membrane immunogenic protein
MKKLLLGTAMSLAMVAGAAAADYPVYTKAPPPMSWTGFYLGAGVGMRSALVDGSVASAFNTFPGGGAPVNLLTIACTGPGVAPCVGEPLNNTAFRFSPYFGYNLQIGPQWLVGVEADVGLGSKTTTLGGMIYPGGGFPFYITGRGDDSFSVKTSWDASVRGRLGFLVTPTFLVYATGGAAWQRVEATSTCGTLSFCNPPNATGFAPGTITDSTTRLGGTIGGGIETMLWNRWLVRGEYRYSDFGTISNTDTRVCPAAGCGVVVNQTATYNLRLTTQTATLGLAYKF